MSACDSYQRIYSPNFDLIPYNLLWIFDIFFRLSVLPAAGFSERRLVRIGGFVGRDQAESFG